MRWDGGTATRFSRKRVWGQTAAKPGHHSAAGGGTGLLDLSDAAAFCFRVHRAAPELLPGVLAGLGAGRGRSHLRTPCNKTLPHTADAPERKQARLPLGLDPSGQTGFLGNRMPQPRSKACWKPFRLGRKALPQPTPEANREIQSAGIESLNRIADCMNIRGEEPPVKETGRQPQ